MGDLSNFVPPPHPKGIFLEGALVRLEAVDPERHGDELFSANTQTGGQENWRYLPYGPFADLASYRQWLASIKDRPDPCFFAIIRKKDNRAVGVASYLRIQPQDGSIEVGHIHFSPLLQRTAEATEAMYLMMGWAFEAGYRRYEWKCHAKNVKSRKAAQRLGFSYEGVFRQASISKGQNRDTAWFAAIDSEWPALKAAFEKYFASTTGTKTGKSPQSLSRLTRPVLFKLDNFEFS
jgi:RimJ/RimL family protein N-acetyltransferase